MNKSYEIDMCNGPLLGKLVTFAIPVMAAGILQLLFNAVNMVVVGRFVGSNALAAVGSTGSLINLMINLFMGFSVGVNVVVARYFGGGKLKDVNEAVHTAICLSLIGGLVLMLLGVLTTRTLLIWMGTPSDVLDLSSLYLKIYFLGMPMLLVYDFGSSILRAAGDTRKPLHFLIVAGLINVALNLLFVVVMGIGVAGAAMATVISQLVSAVLILRWLRRSESAYHLEWKQLRIHKTKLMQILRVGLPAGVQGMVFSFSNVLIQSSINGFGSVAMAGNTAAGNIEGFIYIAMNAFYQTTMSFTSQNFGAHKPARIKKTLMECLVMVTAVGLVLGTGAFAAGRILLGLYTSDPNVIAFGIMRMSVICSAYCLCGIMEVIVGSLRGIGYSVIPMVVSLMGACVFRIIWILTVFQVHHSLKTLYFSYPVSWGLTITAHAICYLFIWKKEKGRIAAHSPKIA